MTENSLNVTSPDVPPFDGAVFTCTALSTSIIAEYQPGRIFRSDSTLNASKRADVRVQGFENVIFVWLDAQARVLPVSQFPADEEAMILPGLEFIVVANQWVQSAGLWIIGVVARSSVITRDNFDDAWRRCRDAVQPFLGESLDPRTAPGHRVAGRAEFYFAMPGIVNGEAQIVGYAARNDLPDQGNDSEQYGFFANPDAIKDRAVATVIGGAYGDALGAGYEFGTASPTTGEIDMIGGGLGDFAPGEWTDDTSMAYPILAALAESGPLTSSGLNSIAAQFLEWFSSNPPDIGNQTRAALSGADEPTFQALASSAHAVTATRPDSSAGNGSLMRTGPVALGYLRDLGGAIGAAKSVSDMTHADPTCAEACMLWTASVHGAITLGIFDGWRFGLRALPPERQKFWNGIFEEAFVQPSEQYAVKDGWVVAALQHAVSAIASTADPDPATHTRNALELIIKAGRDTDTVACIAGTLLGARYGTAVFDINKVDKLHGWPGVRGDDLTKLARTVVERQL